MELALSYTFTLMLHLFCAVCPAGTAVELGLQSVAQGEVTGGMLGGDAATNSLQATKSERKQSWHPSSRTAHLCECRRKGETSTISPARK